MGFNSGFKGLNKFVQWKCHEQFFLCNILRVAFHSNYVFYIIYFCKVKICIAGDISPTKTSLPSLKFQAIVAF